MSQRPTKKQKTLLSPAELINSIPPPPCYDPLPYRQISRPPQVQLLIEVETDPYSLFKLFITDKHFDIIALNTNAYAESKQAGIEGKRTWRPTYASEIQVFIATFIYMGVIRLPANADYWSTKYGYFHCAQHISLNRFEDLKRFIHISPPDRIREDDEYDESSKLSTI